MEFREIRKKKALSQWDITILTGISQSKICLFELGYVNPSADEISRLAEALSVKAESIQWPNRRRKLMRRQNPVYRDSNPAAPGS